MDLPAVGVCCAGTTGYRDDAAIAPMNSTHTDSDCVMEWSQNGRHESIGAVVAS